MQKIFSLVNIIFLICILFFSQINSSFAGIRKFKVTSQDFENKRPMPDINACEFLGSDKSPQLSFSNAPTNTQSFALIMFDKDAPDKNFVHWIVFNIPADLAELQQDIPNDTSPENGTKQGRNGTGEVGYFGPCPPPKETHRYIFNVFALDTNLNLDGSITKKELVKAMKGHILGKGKIVGLYKNNTNN